MKISLTQYRILGIFIAVAVLVLDQCSKLALLNLAQTRLMPLEITSFFQLVVAWNQGVSFGMFSHMQAWMPLVITLATAVIVLLLAIWLAQAQEAGNIIGLSFIIGGAVGNIIDRARFGAVTDFLDFHWHNYHWPAFNVADSCIFIGVVILLLLSIVKREISRSS